jgi:drug/metabolite transporter (DMT)-like permease
VKKVSETPKQRVLLIAGFMLLLPSLVLAIASDSSDADVSRGFARFANAFLTTYTLASIFFIVNMFRYSKSRREPNAPWISMTYAAALGILASVLLTSQGGLLLENNSGSKAQILTNVVHFIATGSAAIISATIMIFVVFVNITSRKQSKE